MIIDPVFIIGAPRSGTSLLFHLLRTRLPLWSLPSEGQHIWDRICHPQLRSWDSEECHEPSEIDHRQRELVLRAYEEQMMPAIFWRWFGEPGRVWQNQASRGRKVGGKLYFDVTKVLYYTNPFRRQLRRRLLDKTASNSLRLELIADMFPDARFIHIKRNAVESISSMVRGWLHPRRFVTFNVPVKLQIEGYNGNSWKFVLPRGWQDYSDRHIVDVCAMQWESCQQRILEFKRNSNRPFMDIKAENLYRDPAAELGRIAEFIGYPARIYCDLECSELPLVNATTDKRDLPFQKKIAQLDEKLTITIRELGYG